MTPKISIIIPVYKAEKFLKKCLDSIISQKYQNYEILLINDGSPDQSGTICNEYAIKYNKIKAYHKENGGVSSARNLGIKEAKGEWICFIDSDDWIKPDFLFEPLNNTDIIHFGFLKETKRGNLIEYFKFETDKEISKDDFFKKGIFSSCSVSFLFKRDLIIQNNILFNENIKYSEDREFIIKAVLSTSNNIQLRNNNSYVYSYNEHSAINSVRAFKNYHDDIIVLKNISEFTSHKNIKISQEAKLFICNLLFTSYLVVLGLCKSKSIKHLIKDSKFLISQNQNTFYQELKTLKTYQFYHNYPILTTYLFKIYWKLRNFLKR